MAVEVEYRRATLRQSMSSLDADTPIAAMSYWIARFPLSTDFFSVRLISIVTDGLITGFVPTLALKNPVKTR